MRSLITLSLLLTTVVYASETIHRKSVCGKDQRELSQIAPIGQAVSSIQNYIGCTVTMISDECAISARHCLDELKYVRFNLPQVPGYFYNSDPEDIYAINQKSIITGTKIMSSSDDWAVFKIYRNSITNKLPGEKQGTFNISMDVPNEDDEVRITGYGTDSDTDKSLFQQTALGNITKLKSGLIHHKVDTEPGVSGAAVILEESDEIIGIHIKGGCSRLLWGSNKAVSIYENTELKNAIANCLNSSNLGFPMENLR
jgi:V8-like Glu-specific endopeptidase